MLRRSTKVQLILFVVITLVGISYVSAEYIGLTKVIFNNGCTVHADFKDSGGIFTNAEVTYRGVTVGKVGALQLISSPDAAKRGVRVDLDLDDCGSPKIPASSAAVIANRSVVGEQYVDLRPPNNKGPYLGNNSIIQMKDTAAADAHRAAAHRPGRLRQVGRRSTASGRRSASSTTPSPAGATTSPTCSTPATSC